MCDCDLERFAQYKDFKDFFCVFLTKQFSESLQFQFCVCTFLKYFVIVKVMEMFVEFMHTCIVYVFAFPCVLDFPYL